MPRGTHGDSAPSDLLINAIYADSAGKYDGLLIQMIAGSGPRKVALVEHISKHVSKTKVIFKCSYTTADLTPEDEVYCALQYVPLGAEIVISNNCM